VENDENKEEAEEEEESAPQKLPPYSDPTMIGRELHENFKHCSKTLKRVYNPMMGKYDQYTASQKM